ncbi:serine/arginine repetitive matrix protein 2 [Nilaparvata lugens]|uniref:serine/arginine repetitive matrix protein 2 n=1 Tax=Nilaparvata lugens TaxID=108931 RepID=UPI00193E1117|nr:serine/arginine repetitive matrix protein 2 [Nilaparvata lugens]
MLSLIRALIDAKIATLLAHVLLRRCFVLFIIGLQVRCDSVKCAVLKLGKVVCKLVPCALVDAYRISVLLAETEWDNPEEWVTKKKVELTTKRQIETRVKRQVVVEDGRVVEDSGPIVTTNTTEDTEKQESTTTEKRDLAGDGDKEKNGENRDRELEWSAPAGTVATQDGLLREVKEKKVYSRQETSELLETEDVQHLGDITDQDYQQAVTQGGDSDLRATLERCRRDTAAGRRDRQRQIQLHKWDATRNAAPGRVVRRATQSRKVVDSEDSQRLHALGPDGKLVTETRTTTEHEEIEGDEQPDSRSGSSHCEEDHKESSTQFARTKQQQLVDYYLGHKRIGGEIKYESETFEGDRQGAPLEQQPPLDWDKMSARARASKQLQIDRKDALTRRPLDPDQEERTRKHETDRWLDSHFGSVSSDDMDNAQVSRPAATSSFINVTMKSSKSPAPPTPPPNDGHHSYLRTTSMSPGNHRSQHETTSSMTPNRSNQTSNERYSYSRSHLDRSDLSSPVERTPATAATTSETRTWYSSLQRNGHKEHNGQNGYSVQNGHSGHNGLNGRATMSSEEEAASPSPPIRPRRRRGQDTDKEASRQLIETERRWRSQHSLVNGNHVTTPTSTPPLPYNGHRSPSPPPLQHSTPLARAYSPSSELRHSRSNLIREERGYSPTELRHSRSNLLREERGYSPTELRHSRSNLLREERGYSPSPELRHSRVDLQREERRYSPSSELRHSRSNLLREDRGYTPSPELRHSRSDLLREERGYSPSPEIHEDVVDDGTGGGGKKKIFQRTRFAAEIPLVKPKPQGDSSGNKSSGGLGLGRSLRKLVNKLGGKSSKNQEMTSQQSEQRRDHHHYQPQSHQQPKQRYYLGEDPFNGGSIYGRESEYHAAAPRRRHSNRIASDHSSSHQNGYRSTSTLGRLSKSTSRLASSADRGTVNARAGGIHTLPRKLHNGVSWQQQQNYRNETSSSSSRLNSDNRSGSLINVSIVNKPKPATTTTTFTSTLGPAKPARTYRSSLLRSKSFSAQANDNNGLISMSPSGGGGGVSSTIHHSSNPQLNRLLTSSSRDVTDSSLKSPGIINSISRQGSDLNRSGDFSRSGDASREASRNLLVRHLIDRVPQLYDALHGNSANGSTTQFGNTVNGSTTKFGNTVNGTTKFGQTTNESITTFGNGTTTKFGNGTTTKFGNTVNGTTKFGNSGNESITTFGGNSANGTTTKFGNNANGSTTHFTNGSTQLGNGQSSVWTSSTTTTVENRRYQAPLDRRGSLSSSGGVVIEVRSGD